MTASVTPMTSHLPTEGMEPNLLPQAIFATKGLIQEDLRRKDTNFTSSRVQMTAIISAMEVADPTEDHEKALRQARLIEMLLRQRRDMLAMAQVGSLAEFVVSHDDLARMVVYRPRVRHQSLDQAMGVFADAFRQAQMTGRDMVVPMAAWQTFLAHWEEARSGQGADLPSDVLAQAHKLAETGTAEGRVCEALLRRVRQLELKQTQQSRPSASEPAASLVLFDSRARKP